MVYKRSIHAKRNINMQYLNSYFPVMPTWINIESVMIIQPNGTILSQYRQISDRNRKKIIKSTISSQNDQQSPNLLPKQKKASAEQDTQKKIVKQKLKNITKHVIEASRKIYRQDYENSLNRLIVDKNLVYYQSRYNVLVIVVVKKFSVDTNDIRELAVKVFNWYGDKCTSMGIDTNIPNVTYGRYELGQFKKLQWQIAHQIDQKVSSSEIDKLPIQPRLGKQEFIKQKFDLNAKIINQREQKLRHISDKVSFIDQQSQKSSHQKKFNDNKTFFVNLVKKILPDAFKEQSRRSRKFKRQSSFTQNTLTALRFMRFKVILLYFCLIVALTLGAMVYFGWFQQDSI